MINMINPRILGFSMVFLQSFRYQTHITPWAQLGGSAPAQGWISCGAVSGHGRWIAGRAPRSWWRRSQSPVGQDPKTTTLLRWTKGVWFESGAQFPTLNDLYIYNINDLNGITGFTHDYPWTLHPCQGNSWCLCCLSSLEGMVTWESHALQSRTLQRLGPQSCTQKQFGNGKSLLNPPGRCLNWFDWGISDHFGIRKTCRKLGLSQNDGWPNFTAIFMGATGSQKCNWSNPEARRTSASRSGHLWFSDFLQHLFQCCSISQQCQRFQKGSNSFPKNCPNKQVLLVTNLLSELSTLSQLIFRLVLTCQHGLWRKENTFGNWIGWELSVGYINQRLICRRILLTFPYFSHLIQPSRAALYYNCSYMIVHVLTHWYRIDQWCWHLWARLSQNWYEVVHYLVAGTIEPFMGYGIACFFMACLGRNCLVKGQKHET